MNNKNKTLAKNTFILSIGQFVPKILTIITLPILTGSFSTSQYGTYDLVISLASLALPLLTLLIQQAVFRFLIEDNSNEARKKYITNSFAFVTCLSFLAILLVTFFSIIYNKNISLIVIACALYISEAYYDLIGQVTRAISKNIYYSIGGTIYSISNMLLLLIFLLTNILNLNTALIAILLSYVFGTIFLTKKTDFFKYISKNSIDKKILKKLLKYSVPIIPSSIGLWVVNLSDRIIVTNVLGSAQNGIYAAASKIPNFIGTLYNVFNLAWTELAARSIKEEKIDKYYSNLLNNLITFLSGLMLIFLILSPFMYKLLINKKFVEGYNQLPILYLGVILNCFVSFYGGLYVALKKTKEVGISSMIGALLNIVINIALINKYGIYAASISTVLSFAIILIYRAVEINKYIKIKYNLIDLFISISAVFISIIFFYRKNKFILIINLLLAIVYNLIENKFLIKMLSFIKNKLIKGVK